MQRSRGSQFYDPYLVATTVSKHHIMSSSSKLADMLSWGLLQFPELFNDLPMIMASLDSGQIISPDSLSNKPLGTYLKKLLEQLPLKYLERQGYCKEKSSPITSISGYILNELLLSKSIVQPSDLTTSQLLSSKTAPILLKEAVTSFPELLGDIPALLGNLSTGGSVQLGGIENEEVGLMLGGLLNALGVKVYDSDDENDSGNENENEEEVESGTYIVRDNNVTEKKALSHMVQTFQSAKRFSSFLIQNIDVKNTNSSSSSSSSKRNENRNDNKSNNPAIPAMMTKNILRAVKMMIMIMLIIIEVEIEKR